MGKLYDLNRVNTEYLKLKKVKLISLIALLAGVLATAGGIALAALVNRNVGTGFILGGLVIAAAAVVLIIFVSKRIKKQVSEIVVEASIKRVLDGVTYNPEGCVSADAVKGADMDFDFEFDRVHGEDHFLGTYGNAKVEMSRVNLVTVKKDTDGEGGSAEKEKGEFKGIWCMLDLGKPFNCELMLKERTNKFSKLATKVFGSSKSISTDNKVFNTQFIITSDDEEAAIELLSEKLMEDILKIDSEIGGNTYIRVRRDGKLHIAVETGKPLFKLDKKLDMNALADKYTSDIKLFCALCDDLKG